jgi:5-methylcytosine-specific restriction protein B
MTDQLDINKTYQAILDAARNRHFISYGELAQANNADWQKVRYKMNHHLGDLVAFAAARKWPLPSAIVVNQNNVTAGTLEGSALEGFITAAKESGFEITDPNTFVAEQQEAMFDWAPSAPDFIVPDDDGKGDDDITGPRFVQFLQPVLDALRHFGGSAKPKDVCTWVADHLEISEEERQSTTQKGNRRFDNQVAWARFYLVKAGLIDNAKRGWWQLTKKGRETYLDQESALALFQDVHARFETTDVSDTEEEPAPEDSGAIDLFDDPERRFWFVGALWDSSNDQTERFIREGIWQNGDDNKFSEQVARMKPGDRVAIKASYVKKYGLPFDNQDKWVSCMKIKAIGQVVEATKDGRTVHVEWEALEEPREWYFYTYRITIVEADASDDLARRLIKFAFTDEKQDYNFWLNQPYWAKQYKSSTPEETDTLLEDEEAEADVEEASFAPYLIQNIVDDGCFLTEEAIQAALQRLQAKKNLILQGPPGTGKTWLAKRLGYALIGTRDRVITRKRMRSIQFHPSISYEDFVRGWRPDGNGQLSLIDGFFLEAVEAARAERDRPFVVIIEEINRGNPAQIFGEMLTLLEKDKRHESEAIELAYHRHKGDRVYIPDNLYVIGTMNIADRSLALFDLALRRRFAFVNLETTLNGQWERWCVERAGLDESAVRRIRTLITDLNAEISGDRTLGPQFMIGHSYITPAAGERIIDAERWFHSIVETEISPLLEEYWFDNPDKAQLSTQKLLAPL